MAEKNHLELKLPIKKDLLSECAKLVREELQITHSEILTGEVEQPEIAAVAYVAMYNTLYSAPESGLNYFDNQLLARRLLKITNIIPEFHQTEVA